jgi:sugar-specific transcriptional regulator TrmB
MIGSNEEYVSLQEFGLSEYESKVYTTLLKYGRMKVKDISLKSGVPRTKAYGVVKSLSEKGLVEFSGKDPLYCMPTAPEEVLSKRLEEEKKRFRKMVLAYKRLEELKKETILPTDFEERKYTVYSMKTFQNRLKEILENTSKSFYACLNWWGLNVLSENIEKVNALSKGASVKIIVGLYNDDRIIERFDSTIDVRVTGKSVGVNIMLFDEKTTVLLEESGKITEINDVEVCRLAKEIIIEKFYKKSLSWRKAYQIIQLGGEDIITLYSGEERVYEAFVQAVAETVFDEEKIYQIGEKFVENLTMMLQIDLFNKGFEVQQPIISALISENLGKDSSVRFDPLTRLYVLETPMASKGLPATVWLFALAGAAKRNEMSFKILQNTSIQAEGKHIIQAKIEKKPLT